MSDLSTYTLKDVCKEHGNSFRLSVDNLQIPSGETFCLVGPTGAGKSTLLRLLSGLEAPTAGELMFDGRRFGIGNLPMDVLRRIVLVSQRPMLMNRTVRSNMEFGLRLRGRARHSSMLPAMLKRLRLTELAGQAAHTLSGGQAQLVALGRALVVEPDVLLLDEPTANLDPAHVALVEEVITEMHASQNTTIVWATHNLFQARRMSHRVGLLLNGQLVETANTETFFEHPSDPRTSSFVQGKMVY